MANYSDKLKSPKWQKKRLEILNLRGFKCELCGNENNELHVHHRFYLKNRQPWEYDNDVFQVLCDDCHNKSHIKIDKIVEIIPEKYKELILTLEKCNNDKDDTDNIIFILDQLSIIGHYKEYLDLLSFCFNISGFPERIFDIISDKKNSELLSIQISCLYDKLKEILPDLN